MSSILQLVIEGVCVAVFAVMADNACRHGIEVIANHDGHIRLRCVACGIACCTKNSLKIKSLRRKKLSQDGQTTGLQSPDSRETSRERTSTTRTINCMKQSFQ